MRALLSTTRGERAGPSKAMSSLPTLNARQKGRAGFASRGLSHGHVPYQSDARVFSSPRSIRNWRGRAISLARSRISHSARIPGSRRLCAQSVSDQLLENIAAREIHHLTLCLSSSAHLVGIDPNEIGLTHGTEALSSDDKIHD